MGVAVYFDGQDWVSLMARRCLLYGVLLLSLYRTPKSDRRDEDPRSLDRSLALFGGLAPKQGAVSRSLCPTTCSLCPTTCPPGDIDESDITLLPASPPSEQLLGRRWRTRTGHQQLLVALDSAMDSYLLNE